MPGVVIFNPADEITGFSTGDDQAAGVYLDIESDALYFTDTIDIFKWEDSSTAKIFTWKSGQVRLPTPVNLGAVVVEAESYVNLTFKLYADGGLVTSLLVTSREPIRLPGGYTSNIYAVELIGSDIVTSVSVAENIFELAEG